MKKTISLILLAAFMLSMAACGNAAQPPAETPAPSPVAAEALPDTGELAAEAVELFFAGDYDNAFTRLYELRDSGESIVNRLLAICHYYGYGCEADAEAAVELLEPLAEGGDCFSAYLLAQACSSGEGCAQNPQRAAELYEKALAGVGSLEPDDPMYGLMQCAAADCYSRGRGTRADANSALSFARAAANYGKIPAMQLMELASVFSKSADARQERVQDMLDKLGLSMENYLYNLEEMNRTEENRSLYSENLRSYEPIRLELEQAETDRAMAKQVCTNSSSEVEKLAEGGNLRAMKLMGDYYFGSLDSEVQDYAKALEYYSPAADENYAPAQAQLALMYLEGYGLEVSYEMAMEWNNRAAMQGNAQGQAQIGYMYHMGLGVTQNLNEAGRWYSRAADQGNAWAAEKLAETEITHPQLAFEFHA